MTLTRVEILRLVRTNRWIILAGVYGFFGLLGPFTARYFTQILDRFGGGMVVEMPEATPVDGLIQFTSNASQIGLLTVIVIAAAALAVDARPEAAAFYRTRVPDGHRILLPRYLVTTIASIAALALGTGLAWAGTAALLGSLPAREVLIGLAYGSLYLAFAIALVAALASVTRTVVTTVFASLAVALMLPLLGLVEPVGSWLPSALVGAATEVVAGVPASEYLRAALMSVVASLALLAIAARRQTVREL
jgi:ABC-2 type transport system permease protein